MNKSKIKQNAERLENYLKGLGCSDEEALQVLLETIVIYEDRLE